MLWDDLDKGDEREGGARERGYVLMQHYKAILLQLKKKKRTFVASEARDDGKSRQESLAWPGLPLHPWGSGEPPLWACLRAQVGHCCLSRPGSGCADEQITEEGPSQYN